MTRRYVVPREDGSYAIPTSIRFEIGIEELTAGVAMAAIDRGYDHQLATNRLTGEAYWSVGAIDDARGVVGAIGRGLVMTAVRRALEAGGYGGILDTSTDLFPRDVARDRAAELWPALDPEAGPFGGGIGIE